MKKSLISFVLIAITSLSMVGCGKDKVSDYNKNRFVVLEDEYSLGSGGTALQIYYDSNTSIVYKRISGSGDGSPLIGQNRLPMTINEYLDSKK